jgi:hypothetical protein
MIRKLAFVSLLLVSACGHVPDRPTFRFELNQGSLARCPDALNLAPTHILWSHFCDVRGFARDSLADAQQNSRLVDLRNIVIFGAAAYGASTLALNAGGLSPQETTDMREAALGIALLQSTNQLYNPINSRDTNLRAFYAYDCVSDTIYLALERDVFVRRADTALARLRADVSSLQVLLDRGVIEDDALIERANTALTSGRSEIDRATAQVNAYFNLPDAVIRARDDIHQGVVERSVRSELSYATLVQAISTTLEQNLAFMNKPDPPPTGPAPDPAAPATPQSQEENSARRLVEAIAGQITELQRITPNISTLSANLTQCTAIMTTGLRVSRPTLRDIGAGRLPDIRSEFYSGDRAQ